ncbi:hypothetical protein [uncultured Chryseobacterium sp.]|uniref:hypothetical protein n=1 Tax=uncultured Chryseobacterium sp. TaxID=259322 RepID=UPI0025F028B0|nr:hypothetical protein [uncultured Chryseobacterium sp.]
MIIGFFLGTVPGAVLLGMNFIRLKKYIPAILTFIAGFAFIPLQNATVPFLYDGHSGKIIFFKRSPEFFISAVGAMILMVLWVVYTPKKFPYRTAFYLLPIIMSCIMLYLIVVNDHNLFSYNMINSLIRSYRELFTES